MKINQLKQTLTFQHNTNKYLSTLAKDLSKEMKKEINPKRLSSVMTKDEFLTEIPKLKQQNYIYNEQNIKNGTFLADLHTHTHYSDGNIDVPTMLNQAVEYGNRLFKLNGKKFIFTISDHDGIKGVKEALKLIAETPEKFENIKFIPASELSFVVGTDTESKRALKYKADVQMPEVLIYNINPFSKTSDEFFSKLYNKRKELDCEIIEYAKKYSDNKTLSFEDYMSKKTFKNKDLFLLNEYWRIFDYLKKDIPNDKHVDLMKKYFPHKNENNVQTKSENVFENIVEYAEKEDAILGLAHPVYFLQNFCPENCLNMLNTFIQKSKGLMRFIEKFHQAYRIGEQYDINSPEEIEFYNQFIDKTNLIHIGGRDNHTTTFL